MFSISDFPFYFRSGLIGAIGSSLIIALIVGLIVRLVRGTDFKQKDMKNAGLINAFLYIGSFMIVGSMLMFMQDYPTVMPVISIVGSLILLTCGLLLYGLVDFLRPVGLAFAYTGLAIMPFWFFAFYELGAAPDLAFFVASLTTMVGYLLVAGLTRSQLAGWISYILLFLFGATLPMPTKALFYTACLLPFPVALFAAICWARRVKWLPVGFRQATSVVARFGVPIIAFFAWPFLMASNVSNDAPFLRSIFFALGALHYLIAWLLEKKRAMLVVARIIFQCFLAALIGDITGYSLFNWYGKTNMGASIAIAIIWLVGSLIQTILSLFVPTKNEDEAKTERVMLGVSLGCIAITPVFCQGLTTQAFGAVSLAMTSVVAILGILITIAKKNLAWGFATLIALLAMPFEVNLITNASWSYWVYYAIYAAISTLALIVYAAGLRKVQVRCAFRIAMTAIIASAVIAAFCDGRWYGYSWPCIPCAVAALQFALLGIASNKSSCYEMSIYSIATAACLFTGSLAHLSPEADKIVNYPHRLGDSLFGLALGGAILGVGLFREFAKKNSARQIVGFVLMSVIMFDAASSGVSEHSLLAPIMLLVAEIITLFIGLITDRKWMAIASASIAAFDVIFFMGSSNWLTFGLVGIAMIGVVVGILVKNNSKPQQQ